MESTSTQFEVLGLEACKFSKLLCPRLEGSTIFWLVDHGPRSWSILFRLEERQRGCKKIFEDIVFPGKRLKFPENLRKFEAKTFFFLLENVWVFQKISVVWEWWPFFLEITFALCPWPREGLPSVGLSLASDFLVSLTLASSLESSTPPLLIIFFQFQTFERLSLS